MATLRANAIKQNMGLTFNGLGLSGKIPGELSLWLDFLMSLGGELWHSSIIGYGPPFTLHVKIEYASYP